MAADPPAGRWPFPPIEELGDADDLVAVGADLEPSTLVDAYRSGYFPMPIGRRRIGWFSPDPRGVLLPGGLHVSRSLRRSLRSYRTTTDAAFDAVVAACADPGRPHGWITKDVRRAYGRLHHLGVAHSVEVWDDEGLAGGLYGIQVGGLFAGESMFHRRTDASKVALVRLVEALGERPDALIDVQWQTPHLATLGIVAIPRLEYAERLRVAIGLPPVGPWTGSPISDPPGPSPTIG